MPDDEEVAGKRRCRAPHVAAPGRLHAAPGGLPAVPDDEEVAGKRRRRAPHVAAPGRLHAAPGGLPEVPDDEEVVQSPLGRRRPQPRPQGAATVRTAEAWRDVAQGDLEALARAYGEDPFRLYQFLAFGMHI